MEPRSSIKRGGTREFEDKVKEVRHYPHSQCPRGSHFFIGHAPVEQRVTLREAAADICPYFSIHEWSVPGVRRFHDSIQSQKLCNLEFAHSRSPSLVNTSGDDILPPPNSFLNVDRKKLLRLRGEVL